MTKDTVLVNKDEWEKFLATVQALVDLHAELLKRSRYIRARYGPMEQRFSSEIEKDAAQAVITRQSTEARFCANCGRDVLENARYCDRCGHRVT